MNVPRHWELWMPITVPTAQKRVKSSTHSFWDMTMPCISRKWHCLSKLWRTTELNIFPHSIGYASNKVLHTNIWAFLQQDTSMEKLKRFCAAGLTPHYETLEGVTALKSMVSWWIPFAIVVQSLSPVWLCDPIDCSMPGFPVLHHLPEFAQVHVHWVGDAIQPSHPLLPSSSSAFNHFQHQGLFQWVGSSHQVDKVLGLQLQHQLLQRVFRVDVLGIKTKDAQDTESCKMMQQIKENLKKWGDI